MAKKSALRIRFVFNAQGGKNAGVQSRQRFVNNFAQQVVENVAFRYSDEVYGEMTNRFEEQFVADARKELVHLTALFRQHITGSSPTNTPGGSLTTVAGLNADSLPIKHSIPRWQPRGRAYLRYKNRKTGNMNWWDARGLSGKKDAKYSGLKKNTRVDTWIKMFGPIRATFSRSSSASALANVPGSAAPKNFHVADGHFRLAVGTLRVYALTSITPQMLPALTTGDPRTMNPATRAGNPGLMDLVRGVDEQMYYRLDRRSSAASGSIYRPTLEPFLAYYLTRSIPAAITNRLAEGRLNVRRRRTN